MLPKEVFEDRDQGLGICQGFILVRGIGFLFHDDIRMGQKKVFIIEGNIADNTEAVGNEPKFKGITEMAIDIHLLDGGICSSMRRHGSIGGLIKVIGIIEMVGVFKSFELFYDAVKVFGVVSGNIGFDAGSVENGHGSEGRINTLTDWLSKIHKAVKHHLQVRKEVLLNYSGNWQKYLPKRAAYVLSYRYIYLLVDWSIVFRQLYFTMNQ